MKTTTAKRTQDVPAAINYLLKHGIRAERIAYELDVAYGTVKSWATGRRKPKKATIMQLQELYGVQIL